MLRSVLRVTRNAYGLSTNHLPPRPMTRNFFSPLVLLPCTTVRVRTGVVPSQRFASSTAVSACSRQQSQLGARERRILYRCKQRGVLELDLLMGTWAEANISRLSSAELDQLEKLSLVESPDLLKWCLKQAEVPAEFDTPLLHQLQEYTSSHTKKWSPKQGNQ